MTTENHNKNFWKSLKDYNDDSEIKEIKKNEFLEGVTDEFEPEQLPVLSRRKFLAVLGASTAFAATACSDYHDKGEIVPYNKRPEEILPGVANYYASTCSGCSNSCSVLVKTREGRPVKIDGNPDSIVTKGKICSKGQAGLLNLYDPERLQYPLKNGRKSDWKSVNKEVLSLLQSASSNKTIAIITNEITSPTFNYLLEDFRKVYPTTSIYSFKQFSQLNRINAWKKCFGNRLVPAIKWNDAKVILSLESDFLGKDSNYVENSRLFAESKDVINNNDMSRLYVVEGGMSLTGMNADYRLRVRPDSLYDFTVALLGEILKKKTSNVSLPKNLTSALRNTEMKNVISKHGLNREVITGLINDLLLQDAFSIVHTGDNSSEDLHALVNVINEVLGNDNLFNYQSACHENRTLSRLGDFEALAQQMNEEKVEVVVLVDSDPVYQLPSSMKFGDALKKVKTKIALTESQNDSSALCDYVLPQNNYLESWGDYHVRTNQYSLQQPVIAPIFDTQQKESVLLSWINKENKLSQDVFNSYLQKSFNENIYLTQNPVSDFKSYWLSSLHDGVVELTNNNSKAPFRLTEYTETIISKSEWTAHIQESYFVGDGSYANNGWLQEIPHPVTKVTWDNYAAIAPATAKELGVENGDVIQLSSGNQELEIPVMIQPGLAEKHLTIETGYGREVIGEVGKQVGFNANRIFNGSMVVNISSVSKTGRNYILASTQEHHSLDDTFVKDLHRIRNIVQEGTLEEFKKNPEFLHEHEHDVFSITSEHKYEGHKWAMAIDLNKCIGCAACVSSCNVENNIPVVGKEQVAKGREMHWMRIDRYYSGTPEEPIPSNQPMLCQHCDNAPCENVCPVNATNHSPDGLNQMAYNRCVGTRYCANNCPFKVRRFNFFNFRDNFEDAYYDNDLTYLVNNPEVTVRSRGVMEKCTFCVQRIMDARSEAIKDGRELRTDEVKTACQVACPAEAIVFGDANDPNSKIAKLREHTLGYHVLEELNVKPNVTYIAKLRNTHSEEN